MEVKYVYKRSTSLKSQGDNHKLISNNNHLWQITVSNFIQRFEADTEKQEEHIRFLLELKEIAMAKEGECLSNNFLNRDLSFKWRCKKGHVFFMGAELVKSGQWCLRCEEYEKKCEKIRQIKSLVKEKEGYCLSEMFTNYNTKLTWKCKQDHVWKMSISDFENGKWCEKCDIGKIKLPTPQLIIRKKKEDHTQASHHQESKTLKLKTNPDVIICELLAEKLGGTLEFKKQKDSKIIINCICHKDHKWNSTIQSLKSGEWCPTCFEENRALNLKELNEIATEQKGRLLSFDYTDNYTNMKWQCEKDHTWLANANNIRRGGWCPECTKEHVHRKKYLHDL